MSMSRRWITREEIAEIHESIAKKVAFTIDPAETDNGFEHRMDHYLSHQQAAVTIREIDGLGHFVGQVYRR